MLLYLALQGVPARRHTLFPAILADAPSAHAAGRAFRPSAVEAATATSTTTATRTTNRFTDDPFDRPDDRLALERQNSTPPSCGLQRTPLVEVADPRAVLVRVRAERARELVVRVRLALAALLLEAAPERVVGVVVHGRELEQHAELFLGRVPAPDAEVRDAERLADRRLLRLTPLRLLERDRGLRRHPPLQMRAALLEEAVRRFAHDPR